MTPATHYNLRVAFADWMSRHPFVQPVPLYRALFRARLVPLRQLQHAPFAVIERELHIMLLGFGMRAAAQSIK